MRRTPVVVGVLLVAVVALLVVEGMRGQHRPARALRLPTAVLVAPRVTAADLRGRPAIVHYWASWCVPCRKEAPELAQLEDRLAGRARLVGVDWSDDRGSALAFVRRHDWRFSNLVDDGGASGQHNGLRGLPTTLIVDADGRIVARLPGPQTVAGLLDEIDRLY